MQLLEKINKWQKEVRLKLGYPLLGNWVANLHSQLYFDYISDKIPKEFFDREISDLGCGDGFATLKIKSLFRAKSIKGYELNNWLIKRARKRGLVVEKLNLGKEVPKGEMAIVWGVLHHIENREEILKKIRDNFRYAVFMEPIKSFWAVLDGGYPLTAGDYEDLFNSTLGFCIFLRFKDNLFVFWKR